MSAYFQPGLYLTTTAAGLEPDTRYSAVWYGYRDDDDPAPVRYSFTPLPIGPSGVLSVRVPYAILEYYAQGDRLRRIRAFVAEIGSEVPVIGPDGLPMCAAWDTYQYGALDPCEP